jgi:hypothetical protein
MKYMGWVSKKNGWEDREFPDRTVGIASLADLTALGLAGDMDPLPDLDIGQDSLGKDNLLALASESGKLWNVPSRMDSHGSGGGRGCIGAL